MGTPSRTSILLDIKSTLTAITVVNGFKTTVVTSESKLRSRDEVVGDERPYTGFGPGRSTYENLMGHMRVTMPWTVVGYVQEDDEIIASAAINDLEDDIIAAVMADPTLGGFATFTKIVDDLTDEADPNRRDISDDGNAAVVNFETIYYRDYGSS